MAICGRIGTAWLLLFLLVIILLDLAQVDAKSKSVCKKPKKFRKCEVTSPRYYYNEKRKECVKYPKGKCGGRRDTFRSKKQCEKRCMRSDETNSNEGSYNIDGYDLSLRWFKGCNLPPRREFCLATFPKYFYNPQTGQCEQSFYVGCRNNGFDDVTSCMAKCAGQKGDSVYSLHIYNLKNNAE